MKQMEQDFTRKIKIEKLLATGIIQEDVQEIKDSYVRQEFIQAIDVLREILRENGNHKNAAGAYGGKGARERDELFNIIPFIGERGTGKTSTMLSFAHMLASFDPEKSAYGLFLMDREDNLGFDWNKQKFVVLQYIDISVLKSDEDILAIILARMLKYVQRVVARGDYPEYGMQAVRQEELRQLYQCFDRTYQDLLNLTRGDQSLEGEFALRRLQNLNSSYSLSENFRELADQFCRFLNRNEGGAYEHHLVISLDDIDLYEAVGHFHGQRKDAYTILGQVYEYLQVPGIIVLTTFDEKRLIESCARHIKKKFPYIQKEESHVQAVQYIQKIILPKYKIYMPSLSYTDYPGGQQLSIIVDKNSDLGHILFPNTEAVKKQDPLVEDVGEEKLPALMHKDLILKYLANVYGCYFDMMGKKQHFFEERTLRKIKNLFLALRIHDEKTYIEADERQREQRYLRLRSYIYNQFTGEKLTGFKETTLSNSWLSMPVERRSREILEYIRSERAKLSPDSYFYYDRAGNEGTYSYGELVRNLYISSRCGILSKEMVHCILASYSLVLSNLYWKLHFKSYDITSEEYFALRNILGTSISGRWSNEILYTTFTYWDEVTKRARAVRIGSVSSSKCEQALQIPITHAWKQGFQWLLSGEDGQEKNGKKTFTEFLQLVEILGMFFTNVRNTAREEQREWKRANYGFQFVLLVQEKPGEKPTRVIPLSGNQNMSNVLPSKEYLVPTSKFACFNILNFVVNSFTWEEYFETLHSSLLNAILARTSNYDGLAGERRALTRRFQSCSLRREFKNWANTYGCCAIPFQHFDMTYNILKRQRDASDHGLPAQSNVTKFAVNCKTVYENIENALKNQDSSFGASFEQNFSDIFSKNPFIQVFKSCEKNKELCDRLAEIARVLGDEESATRSDVVLKPF